ncbi:MAG: prepilin peptidase [Leptolyngbyaceae cyanobacterium bins.59]|nr:prepilin peptidase [Leptolyngbyaceae cyanobacterium bins.59]
MQILVPLLVTLIVFAIGASIGSFLNVVIYRIPAGRSILWPPSHCPQCKHRLGNQENVPVLGWFMLKGRCKHCRTPISIRYPLIEALTGLLFVLVFWRIDLPQESYFSLQTLGYWTFFSWLLALSVIDLDTLTLPNVLTKSGLVLGLLFQAIVGFAMTGDFRLFVTGLMSGILGAVVGIWLLDTISWTASLLLRKEAMGGGDAKLAAMMGAWLGWQNLLLASFMACGIGAFLGGGAIAIGLLKRGQPMPFGPFLALGAMIAALWGQDLIGAYLQIFFPIP